MLVDLWLRASLTHMHCTPRTRASRFLAQDEVNCRIPRFSTLGRIAAALLQYSIGYILISTGNKRHQSWPGRPVTHTSYLYHECSTPGWCFNHCWACRIRADTVRWNNLRETAGRVILWWRRICTPLQLSLLASATRDTHGAYIPTETAPRQPEQLPCRYAYQGNQHMAL